MHEPLGAVNIKLLLWIAWCSCGASMPALSENEANAMIHIHITLARSEEGCNVTTTSQV